ncbi:DUF2905 domain-containing protein [Neorhizobium petrolearium]|uniref:DUF2905 domain-containing protein n=1 Tax=Neorhizobium petrolearium TaxID=515361 RepID=A0ABY8M3H2_9HYPH|nr:DUF2905 domain-containing protein [Neorhizobium petrolearium]MCC2608851.1 DUF2905 domain-containing protein [Neorhizobium petrolearium]WGI69100.1 DUF2905 domain-containing protein [Neorhizobium petrolearium]
MNRTLIIVGLVIVAIGLLWPWLSRLGLGRLPGDIVIRRGNFTFYAPIATALLASVALSVIVWLLRRYSGSS